MGFVDLFRPKWKHSDATVRATAVRNLGAEELATLEQVARGDRDPDIRRIAVKKINDVDILFDLSDSDPDEAVRDLARQRGSTLILGDATAADDAVALSAVSRIVDLEALCTVAKSGESEPARRAALERIDDAKALADIARNAANQELQLEALGRISDQPTLRAIAMAEPERVIALAALDRVDDAEALADIARKGKNKAVRKRAKTRVQDAASAGAAEGAAAEPSSAPAAATSAPAKTRRKKRRGNKNERASQAREKKMRSKQLSLCRQVEAMVDDPDLLSRLEALDEARVAMRALEGDDHAEAALTTRFGKAMAAADKQIARLRDAEQAAEQAEAEAEAAAAQWVTLIDEVSELSAEEATREKLDAMREAFAALGQLDDEARQGGLERGFERACRDAEKRYREKDRAQNDAERAQQIVERAQEIAASARIERAGEKIDALAKDLERLGDAVDQDAKDKLAAARKTLQARVAEAEAKKAEREQKNEQRIQAVLAKLDETLAGTSLRDTDRLLKDVTQALKKMGPLPSKERAAELESALETAKTSLYNRLQELRQQEDWKRWSNVPKREALCERAEKLLELEDLGEAAKQLRQLQNDWKKVGPVPREKSDALWERFKGACDKVREKCSGYFAEREAERDENLKAKQALCEQAEALATSTEWNETADKLKALQTEWKNIGAVPRKQSDAVWKRFRAACDTFFNARKSHLEERDESRLANLEKKQALCEQAEGLAASTAWDETAGRLKSLQAQWKKIGPVPRSQSDAIWKRFRGACDQFFDARQAFFDGERQRNLDAKQAICEELEALVSADGDHATAVLDAKQRFFDLGPAPRDEQDAVWERFVKASEAVVLAHPDAFKGTELDPVGNLRKLDGAVKRAEKIVASLVVEQEQTPSISDADDAAALAEKLQAAMASNTFAEREDPAVARARAVEELTDLASRVARLGPMDAEKAAPLQARFDELTRELLPKPKKRKPRKRKAKGKGAVEAKAEAPKAEAPKAEAPAAEAPAAEAPAAEAPAAEAPAAEAPAAEAPAAEPEAPAAEAPAAEPEAPATEAPAAEAPAAEPEVPAAEAPAAEPEAEEDLFAEDDEPAPPPVTIVQPPSRKLSISERLKALDSKLNKIPGPTDKPEDE